MLARLDVAVTKRCNGVDPDNMDRYDSANGLGLTQADAVACVSFFAEAAHGRNLSTGLKNACEVVPEVIDKMEWSVQEQGIQFGDCESYRPFIDQGKPVFHVEYPKGAYVNNNASITPDQKTSKVKTCKRRASPRSSRTSTWTNGSGAADAHTHYNVCVRIIRSSSSLLILLR